MPNSIKKNIIKEVRNKYYNYNIKFLSLEEFIEKYTFSYALADTTNLNAKIAYHEIGSGLNAGLSTEGTRTMTFTGTLFSLFAENGKGTFETGVALTINPDVDYKL